MSRVESILALASNAEGPLKTVFGCEHSFARATESVQEHYGFEIETSAVQTTTFKHALRAQELLQEQCAQPFRLLPSTGQEHVIAEADGTMIGTVKPGQRKGKRPPKWKEMRLVVAHPTEAAATRRCSEGDGSLGGAPGAHWNIG